MLCIIRLSIGTKKGKKLIFVKQDWLHFDDCFIFFREAIKTLTEL